MRKNLIVVSGIVICLVLLGVIFAATAQQQSAIVQKPVPEKPDPPTKTKIIEKQKTRELEIPMAKLEINNDLQRYGVEIIGPSESEFDPTLKRLTGDSNGELASIVEIAKPISLIIVNNSGKNIEGVSLKWELSTWRGINSFPQTQSSSGELMGIRPRDPKMKGRTSLIRTGEAKLFSYDRTMDQVFQDVLMNRGNNQHLAAARSFQSDDALLQMIEQNKKNLLNSISRFSVSIDGVFFSDGAFAGTDQFFFFESMRGQVDAHYDLISLLSETSMQESLSQTLTDYVSQNRAPRRRQARPDSPEAAYRQGYNWRTRSISEEISKRRTKFTDQIIVNDYLTRQDKNRVVLHKLNR